jgi:gliding motility-associated lipoprotein GldH
LKWTIPLIVSLFLISCTNGVVIDQYKAVADDGWKRTDTLCFRVPPVPQTADYDISLGIRHTNAFPYEGIWIVAETRLQHPKAFRHDTLYFVLCDKRGMPVGKGVNLIQAVTPLNRMRFVKGQSGSIRLRQIMSREVIPGISEVGVQVRKGGF